MAHLPSRLRSTRSTGSIAEDPKTPILRSLGLDRDIPFVDVGDLHEVRSPLLGEPFVLPHGLDAALAATKQRFPHQGERARRIFRAHPRGSPRCGDDERASGRSRLVAVERADLAVAVVAAHSRSACNAERGAATPVRRRRGGQARAGTEYRILHRRSRHDAVHRLCHTAGLLSLGRRPLHSRRLSGTERSAGCDRARSGRGGRGGPRSVARSCSRAIVFAVCAITPGTLEIHRRILRRSCSEMPRRPCSPPCCPSRCARVQCASIGTDARRFHCGRSRLGSAARSREFGVRRYSTAILPAWVTALADLRQARDVFFATTPERVCRRTASSPTIRSIPD